MYLKTELSILKQYPLTAESETWKYKTAGNKNLKTIKTPSMCFLFFLILLAKTMFEDEGISILEIKAT